MNGVTLKTIVGKKKDLYPAIAQLFEQLSPGSVLEDENGQVLLGEPSEAYQHSFPVYSANEIAGQVKGDEKGELLAELLSRLLQKEAEKKKLGSEVLSLYHEINVIYNFSERISQTIEPDIIARITLEQAVESIATHAGVMVLWDQKTNLLQIPFFTGEPLFDTENLKSHAGHLLKIGMNGQSEIIHNVAEMQAIGIVHPEVKSLVYAAMRMKHRVMGAIILAAKDEDHFSAAHLKLLVTLALQSSAAIESALLYERTILEAREREEAMMRIHEVTKKFVPYEFIHSLGKETLTDVKLGDQVEKIVTVLFTDIRDFTTLSELMTPEENFRFVSAFNSNLGPIIRQYKGFINQYLGDSIMAIFPGGPNDALQAAIQMQQAVRALNAERAEQQLPPIHAGIGMHTGPLIMGITGDDQRMDAATISDTVNTASRIESLTKHFKSALLLSEETYLGLNRPEQFHFRRLGQVRVKGKHRLLTILECFDGHDTSTHDFKKQTLPVFNEAMHCYHNKQFEQAILQFQSLLVTNPADDTIQFFMGNAIKYHKEGVPDHWIGAEEMLAK